MFALIIAAAAMSAGGGIGGGGLYIPILMLIGGFGAHTAIPLSKPIVVGGALGCLAVSWRRKRYHGTGKDSAPSHKRQVRAHSGRQPVRSVCDGRRMLMISHDRTVVDWDTVLLMEPMTLAGTFVGVYGNVSVQRSFVVGCNGDLHIFALRSSFQSGCLSSFLCVFSSSG